MPFSLILITLAPLLILMPAIRCRHFRYALTAPLLIDCWLFHAVARFHATLFVLLMILMLSILIRYYGMPAR